MSGPRSGRAGRAPFRPAPRPANASSYVFIGAVVVVAVTVCSVLALAPGAGESRRAGGERLGAPGPRVSRNGASQQGTGASSASGLEAGSDRASAGGATGALGAGVPRAGPALPPSDTACPHTNGDASLLAQGFKAACKTYPRNFWFWDDYPVWCKADAVDPAAAPGCPGPDDGAAADATQLAPGIPDGPAREAVLHLLRHAAAYGRCATDPAAADDPSCEGRRRLLVSRHIWDTGLGNYVVAASAAMVASVTMRRGFAVDGGLATTMLRAYFGSPMRALGVTGPAGNAGWYLDCGAGGAAGRLEGMRLHLGQRVSAHGDLPLSALESTAFALQRRCPAGGAAAVRAALDRLPEPPLTHGVWPELKQMAAFEAATPLLTLLSGSATAAMGQGACRLAADLGVPPGTMHAVGVAALLSNPTARMLGAARRYKDRVGWGGFNVSLGLQIRACVDCGWSDPAWSSRERLGEQLACARGVLDGLLGAAGPGARAVVFFTTDKPSIFPAVRAGLGPGVTVLGSGRDGGPPDWFHSTSSATAAAQRDQLMLDIFMLGETDAVVATGTTFSRIGAGRTLTPLHVLPFKDNPKCKAARPLAAPACEGGWADAAAAALA